MGPHNWIVIGRGGEAIGIDPIQYREFESRRRKEMIWTVLVILLVLWVIGFAVDIAGGLIHVLLVAAAIVLLVKFIGGRR